MNWQSGVVNVCLRLFSWPTGLPRPGRERIWFFYFVAYLNLGTRRHVRTGRDLSCIKNIKRTSGDCSVLELLNRQVATCPYFSSSNHKISKTYFTPMPMNGTVPSPPGEGLGRGASRKWMCRILFLFFWLITILGTRSNVGTGRDLSCTKNIKRTGGDYSVLELLNRQVATCPYFSSSNHKISKTYLAPIPLNGTGPSPPGRRAWGEALPANGCAEYFFYFCGLSQF